MKQELGVKKAFGGEVVKNESEDGTVTTPTGSIDSNKLVDSGIITSQSFKTPPMKGKLSPLLLEKRKSTKVLKEIIF